MGGMLNSARGDERDGEEDFMRSGGETKEGHYFRKIQELEQQLFQESNAHYISVLDVSVLWRRTKNGRERVCSQLV